MPRQTRESVVVFGLVAALLLASVASLALPALQVDDREETRDRGDVSDRVPTPSFDGTADETSAAAASGQAARPSAAIDCDPDDVPAGVPVSDPEAVTGENVSVAVIDPSGFDVDDPELTSRVAGARSFDRDDDLTVENGGDNQHGTVVARQVSETAPGATLHLANFRTAHDFTRAVEWAIRQDVDVIVAPTVFYAKPNDGTAPVSRAVSRAAEEGIAVVVPTGNVAARHWEGSYDGGGAVEFRPNETRMYVDGEDRRIEAWLWWNRSDGDRRHEFDVVLYRETDDGARRIAESRDHPTGPVGTNQVLVDEIRPTNPLSRLLGDGEYFLRIEGPPDGAPRVELVVATHRLERPTAAGSVMAPATAEHPGVVSVGAARPGRAEPLPRSGRGPTNDARRGVDVLAPATVTGEYSLTGTSAATAHAGGLAALVRAQNPTLTPAEVAGVLAETADGEAVTEATGHGTVDRDAALECARTAGV